MVMQVLCSLVRLEMLETQAYSLRLGRYVLEPQAFGRHNWGVHEHNYDNEMHFRWFWRISKAAAERQLMEGSNQYGSFLIRDSDTTPGSYSLSIRDKERVRHYRIKCLENGTFL